MMSSETDHKSLSGVPRWDGKEETCPRYMAVFEAIGEYHGCEDVFDTVAMTTCPTKSEYDLLIVIAAATVTADQLKQIKLYKDNKRMCAYYTLGQETDSGLAVISKTKTSDFPQGRIIKVMESLRGRNKPNDASAEIRLDAKLDAIRFTTGRKFYDSQVEVLAKFDVGKTDTDLIKLLAKKVGDPTFAKLIIDHLNKDPVHHDIQTICTEISQVQDLMAATGAAKSTGGGGKEVQLTSTEQYTFKGVCGHCKKKAGHKRAGCPDRKQGGGGGGGSGSNKTCNHCGSKGHIKDKCWKKHPDKSPEWYKNSRGRSLLAHLLR